MVSAEALQSDLFQIFLIFMIFGRVIVKGILLRQENRNHEKVLDQWHIKSFITCLRELQSFFKSSPGRWCYMFQ